MSEREFEKLCKRFGMSLVKARTSIRETALGEKKSRLVIYLRESLLLTYSDIADLLHYYDRSGARQAYTYALQKYGKQY